jgi:imidazolonepropionase-like amidohydrolase
VLVQAGSLIDGRSDTPRREVTIVVEGERIVDVVAGYKPPPPGETVVDLRQLTVVPGLIDMHVHLDGQLSPTSYIERFTLNPADLALQAAKNARTTLRAGFTTVRNLGDGYNATVSLREAIRKGWVEGPRIYTAGKSLATTGGHADPTNGFAAAIGHDPGPAEGVVNGPEDARKAVRQRYKDGADLIKLTATGGVLSLARNADNPQFTDDELKAVVATASDYGFAVAVHAHGAEGMKRAIRAGVDSIEHGTRLDDEVVKLMLEHGTYLVATLSGGPLHGRDGQGPGWFPRWCGPKAARSARSARRASRGRTRPASRSPSAPTPASRRTATTPRSSSTWSRPACRR